MSLYIDRFIDRVQGQDARGGTDLVMSMTEAKGLLADITRLLLALETARSKQSDPSTLEIVSVSVQGGSY